MKNREYVFYEDPGHGWLEVRKSELVELGIADKISHYSYECCNHFNTKFDLAFLEEDCDAPTFCDAFKKKYGCNPSFVYEVERTDPSFIRDLPNYSH